jgi:hypothetical protein
VRTDELRVLLSRIRWVNLAGLVGLPALALAIVLWPRLAPSPPAVPDAAPRPVVDEPARREAAAARRDPTADAIGAEPRRRASPGTHPLRRASRASPAAPRAQEPVHRGEGGRSGARRRARDARRRRGARPRPRPHSTATAPAPAATARPVPAPAATAPSVPTTPASPPDPVAAEFGVP